MSTVAGEMDWRAVNNVLYGKTGLTSQTFWNYYGGDANTYEVKVTTKEQNTGREIPVVSGYGLMGDVWAYSGYGFDFQVLLNQGDTQTSNIKIGVYNGINTENRYMDVNGLGAEYIVTLTIKSDNVKAKGDIVLTQKIYVKEDCKSFDYNPLYYVASYQGYDNCVIVKGQLKSTWEMSSNVSEHFKMIDNKNIFQYYNTINNVTGLNFAWATGTTGVTYDANAQEVKLNAEMTKPYEVKNMTYRTTLANGDMRGISAPLRGRTRQVFSAGQSPGRSPCRNILTTGKASTGISRRQRRGHGQRRCSASYRQYCETSRSPPRGIFPPLEQRPAAHSSLSKRRAARRVSACIPQFPSGFYPSCPTAFAARRCMSRAGRAEAGRQKFVSFSFSFVWRLLHKQ